MEKHDPNTKAESAESLAALRATASANVSRLNRPKRYWIFFAAIFMVYGLLPLFWALLPLAGFGVSIILAVVTLIVASRTQPTAVRKIRMTTGRLLPVLGFVAGGLILVSLSSALYAATALWIMPVLCAAVIFVYVACAGPAVDRSWARSVSSRNA